MSGTPAVDDEQTPKPTDDEVTETDEPEVETETADEAEKPDDVEVDEGEKAPETKPEDAPKTLTVRLDADEDDAPAPGDKTKWALQRQELKEAKRERDELRARLAQPATRQEAAPVLPPMPKPSDKDIGYDEDKLSQRMAEWVEARSKVNAHQAKTKAAQQEEAQEKAASHGRYAAKRDALKETAPAYLDAERVVCSALSVERQNDLMEADLDDPTKVVLALAQYPEELAAAVAIRSLPKFIKHLVALEKKVSVTPPTKKPKAPPEKTISGGGNPTTGNKVRDALEAEAQRTGNRSKIADYDRQQREKSRKK